jgi:hypothetical protein
VTTLTDSSVMSLIKDNMDSPGASSAE